jgi:chemotaxis protein CheC
MESLPLREMDQLRRISVAGAREAERALGQMTGIAIRLEVARVQTLAFPDVPALLGGDEAPVVGIHLKVYGECRANVLLALPPDAALRVLGLLFPPGVKTLEEMGEMEISGLMEMGNIVTCAYLNALSAALGMSFIPSVPMLANDMAGAVVDVLLIEQGQRGDAALVVQTEISSAPHLRGQILMMPDPAALPKIVEALREHPVV